MIFNDLKRKTGYCIQTEMLIKALEDLEHSASSDAAVRERIAALPPEVSDASLLGKLSGKNIHNSGAEFVVHWSQNK